MDFASNGRWPSSFFSALAILPAAALCARGGGAVKTPGRRSMETGCRRARRLRARRRTIMAKPRVVPLPAIILVTLLVQLATPGVAWADGESPPTEAQPAVEVSDEALPTIAEILEAAPPGTEVVVIDPSGTPEPLATEQAAGAIAESDPIWCPGSVGPSDLSCTPSQTSVTALLEYLDNYKSTYSGEGTIYFTAPDALPYAYNDAYFRGSDPRLSALTGLTINDQAVGLSVPLEVTGWAYDVSIVNLNMDLRTYGVATPALRIETSGSIQLTDVGITGSSGDGAVLDNTSGSGLISVTDSTFNANTWTGLDARSNDDITLTNVTATGQEDGAYLDASTGPGTVAVNGGDFSSNTLAGLTAKAAEGGVSISNVTANDNSGADAYGVGVTATNNGSVTVTTSEASRNGLKGLWIEGTGPILLDTVTASQNGVHGAYLHNIGACAASPISVTVDGGIFSNNVGYGVLAVLGPNGAFTLTGTPAPVFAGNGLGNYAVNLDPCPECEHKEEGKPYNAIYVPETGTPPVPLDCTQYSGTIFIFPSGDRATLTCPVSGEATLRPVHGDGPPGPLPAARSFVSGASVVLTKDGQPVSVLTEGGYLTIAFTIPKELKGASLAILYWDPLTSAWVELPAYSTRPDGSPMVHRLHPNVTPDDLMYILGGVRVTGDTVKVKVTFGGTFVLISR
jgi:Right handed beta helix region